MFHGTHYGKSVTRELDETLSCTTHNVDDAGGEVRGAISVSTHNKANNIVRTMQSAFNLDDRAPAALYRLNASSFPYAAKVPKAKPNGGWHSVDHDPTIAVGSAPSSFADMSLYNMTSMLEGYSHFAHETVTILQTGIEFLKEDAPLHTFADREQSDMSEIFHSAHAVMSACCFFTQYKSDLEVLQCRSTSAWMSVMCGKGCKAYGAEPVPLVKRDDTIEGMRDDDFAPSLMYAHQPEMDDNDENELGSAYPKGAQAFADPRILSGVDRLVTKISAVYDEMVLWAWQARERMKHLLTVVDGPHGSCFRNMRDHSLVGQLVRWIKAKHCFMATLTPLEALIVDTDLHGDWMTAVDAQWRHLPELFDEVNYGAMRRVGPRALRLPPIQLLAKLKLSYDFAAKTHFRSLMTHGDPFLYRAHLGRTSAESIIVYERGASGVQVNVEASEQLDPFLKTARFMTTPNGLIQNNVLNEDVVNMLMARLELPEVFKLMKSSRVFYQLCAKFSQYWVERAAAFLEKHRRAYPLVNARADLDAMLFRGEWLPRIEGNIFQRDYMDFYVLRATMVKLFEGGVTFCAHCLKETCFRSQLHGGRLMCTGCYEKFTITAEELKSSSSGVSRFRRLDWFRSVASLRAQLPSRLEYRPNRVRGTAATPVTLHAVVLFNKVAATLVLMQMSNLALAHSPQFSLDMQARLSESELRYVLGGPHGQLHEPRVVKLCSNYYKYCNRQYGVNKVTIKP